MIAVDVVKSNSAINIALEQMWLDQCHSTASGKVLLSALTDEEYEDFINSTPLNKLTEHTVCDPLILKKELEQIRRDGYSVVRDESVFGVSSIGVPVCGRNWHPVAALGIAFSSYFLNDQYLQRQLTLLNKYRRKLEKKLLS
jgi:IclR family pca regulon transcriptional regulator